MPIVNRCPPRSDILSFVSLPDTARNRSSLAGHLKKCPGCREQVAQEELVDWIRDYIGDGPLLSLVEVPALPAPSSGAEPLSRNAAGHPVDAIHGDLPVIAGYDIVRRIRRGGQGVVYEAVQKSIGRSVAIKVLPGGPFADEARTKRLVREAKLAGSLRHPGIVTIHEAGLTARNDFFIAMDYVEGRRLDEYLSAERPSLRARLDLFCLVCDAVDFAHQHGVIHRDLKPANILVDDKSAPHLLDFGLAIQLEHADRERLTMEGQALGTANYMSPEQAEGRQDDLDRRTDVYALGVILLEIGNSADSRFVEAARGRKESRHPYARRFARETSNELRAIVRKATAHAPERRHATAAMLGGDVRRFLSRPDRDAKALTPLRPAERDPLVARCMMGALVPAVTLMLALLLGPPTKIQGPVSIPRMQPGERIFVDHFDDEELDLQLWKWGQTKRFSYPDSGHHQFQVSELNGTLLLDARATHEDGWTAIQDLWLDSTVDLKLGVNLLVEIDMEMTLNKGDVFVLAGDGSPPRSTGDPASVQLYHAQAFKQHPIENRRRKLRILLAYAEGLAIVLQEGVNSPSPRVVDLGPIDQWKLRFYASARSSTGYPTSRVQLILHDVSVTIVEGLSGIVGRAVDRSTGQPLGAVQITVSPGGREVRTASDGSFYLPLPSGVYRMDVRIERYSCVGMPRKLRIASNAVRRMMLEFDPFYPRYGDAVAVVPFEDDSVTGFVVDKDTVTYAGVVAGRVRLCRLDIATRRRQQFGATIVLSGLAVLRDALYALESWPGRIYALQPDGAPELVATLPLDVTVGLASDGDELWLLQRSHIRNQFRVCSYDPSTQNLVPRFVTSDTRISGLAFGRDRLWVASSRGFVYEVNPVLAQESGTLEAGIVRRFRGKYHRLAYADGHLWGIDVPRKQFCKIFVGPADE